MNSSLFKDGFCDQYTLDLDLFLNSAMCMWDGGDCCPSTCQNLDGTPCTLMVYDCLDPLANDLNTESECGVASPSWLADAYCDATGDGCVAVGCFLFFFWAGGRARGAVVVVFYCLLVCVLRGVYVYGAGRGVPAVFFLRPAAPLRTTVRPPARGLPLSTSIVSLIK